jgi:hypothetical protein
VQIKSDLDELGVSDETAGVVVDVVAARRVEVTAHLKEHAATQTVSSAYLADFDWSVRLVMSSDRMASMREPVLLLSLSLGGCGGEKRDMTVELSRSQLDTLLATCDDAAHAYKQLC